MKHFHAGPEILDHHSEDDDDGIPVSRQHKHNYDQPLNVGTRLF